MTPSDMNGLRELLDEERERLRARDGPPQTTFSRLIVVLVAVFFLWAWTR